MIVFIDRRRIDETVMQRGRGRLSGAGAGVKWLYNKARGRGDQNAAGFRETTRNAKYIGTIKAHAKALRGLLGEMDRFIAQQAAEGKDTSALEGISSGLNDFFAKNEKIFGFGIGDADAEDYKNVDLGGESRDAAGGGEAPATPETSGGEASPAPVETSGGEAAPVTPETSGGEASTAPAETSGGTPGERPRSTFNPGTNPADRFRAVRTESAWGGLADGEALLESISQPHAVRPFGTTDGIGYWNYVLRGGETRGMVGEMYNLLAEEAAQPGQGQQAEQTQMNDVAAKVFAQLGDMADKGTEEDKDFVYQLIQKLASGRYTMQNAMQDIASRAQQGQQGQQGQQVAAEAFDGARRWMEDQQRKFFARQAGKQAAKSGGDRKAAEQEAYGNRIYEFQTRLDRELGELSLDLKTMGYKQQAGDADRLLKAFRQAVAQYSKSGKEEGETSWLQRRRHGLGHWAATWATYRALHMLCPATILGSPYFRKAVMGAATSVIRDVSRDNLNKKSILRALAGAGIAVGATIAGEMIRPSIVSNEFNAGYSNAVSTTHNINGAIAASHNGIGMSYNGTMNTAGNLGTKIRAMFDSNLRDKLGLRVGKSHLFSGGYGGDTWSPHYTGETDHWGDPEVDYYTRTKVGFGDFVKKARAAAAEVKRQLVDGGMDPSEANAMVNADLQKAIDAARNGGSGIEEFFDASAPAQGVSDAAANAAANAAGTAADVAAAGTPEIPETGWMSPEDAAKTAAGKAAKAAYRAQTARQ